MVAPPTMAAWTVERGASVTVSTREGETERRTAEGDVKAGRLAPVELEVAVERAETWRQ